MLDVKVEYRQPHRGSREPGVVWETQEVLVARAHSSRTSSYFENTSAPLPPGALM